jgi:hypothetical protein
MVVSLIGRAVARSVIAVALAIVAAGFVLRMRDGTAGVTPSRVPETDAAEHVNDMGGATA